MRSGNWSNLWPVESLPKKPERTRKMGIIKAAKLAFDYLRYDEDGNVEATQRAVDGVDLDIQAGEFVAVLGHNGSGKSTLAKIIMGLFKPDSGQILFDGQDITNLSITERAKLGIGFAFQQPVKFKGLTVKDLIEIAAGNSIKLAEACDYLSDVGLCAQEYLNREISASLSGGELKRIEIAMLAAKKSKLTIFDEPEAGIDLWSFNNLISVFEKMHQKINGSIIVISHQEKILNIADEIILLNNGKIIDKGPKENMLPKLLDKKVSCRKADYLGGVQNGTK